MSGHKIRLPGGYKINKAGKVEKDPYHGLNVSAKLKAKGSRKIKVARPTINHN